MKKIIIAIVAVAVVMGGFFFASNQTTKTGDTFTYESVNGPVEVPTDPQRVVTDYYVGNLLAIGVPVVGADLTYTSPAWTDEMLEGITDIGQSTEIVASLEPDLIITFNADAYETYSTIAPTVYIPYGMYNEEEIVLELGKITNHEEEAEAVIDEFHALVAEAEALIDNPELTYSIIEWFNNEPYAYGNKFGRFGYVIYDVLDLKGTTAAEETILVDENSYVVLTLENLADYVGDVLIMSTPGAEPISNEITESEVFKSTSAYQNDRIYYVDSTLFYHTDMISIKAQFEVMMDIFADDKL